MRLRLHPAALVEFDLAVDYLEEQREGFGGLRFDEITRRTALAARWPRNGAPVSGFKEHRV